MTMLRIIHPSDSKALDGFIKSRRTRLELAERTARRIVEDVRRHGDRALIRATRRFDGLDLRKTSFVVRREEILSAYDQVPEGFVEALRIAARNVRAFAARQAPRAWAAAHGPGVKLGQLVRPLDRVACYIPGGRFPLPSTVLMSVIPAQAARVREIFLTTPRPAPAVLVAADLLGIRDIFRLGGAQAIAAFAYGTETVPRVDKIVGPGNRYVAAAKKLIAGECGIDFVAGPTEVVIVASRGQPRWIAADLVAQAEHDPDAMALFITTSIPLARLVQAAVERILRNLRVPVARTALARQGAVILTRRLEDALDLVNTIAPEHLALLGPAMRLLPKVRSAGSVFLGDYSALAAGDYASGSNHILPTGGGARLRGGLGAADFVKTISVQQLRRRGLARLRHAITTLADTEGLKAHAYSVEARFESDGPTP